MNLIKKVMLALAGLVGLFVVVGLFLPRTAHVERAIVVEAPQATVFTVLNSFRQFNQWSPWADIDPHATTTMEGPATGVGAKMSWSGNAEVGTGGQEITASTPNSEVKVKLSFGDFPGDFGATYALTPEGAGTKVVWSFDADYGSSITGRYFGLLSDRMLGPDYERGLARLKQFVEALPKGDFSALQIESVDTPEAPIVFTTIRATDDANAIGVGLGVAYSRLNGYLNTQKVKQVAAPVAIFRGKEGDTLVIDAAIPVAGAVAASGEMKAGTLPAGRAVKATYHGPSNGLGTARQQFAAYLATAGLEAAGARWEQYASDVVTLFFLPVK